MTEFPKTRSTLLVQVRSADNREAWEEFVLVYRPVIYRMARRRGLQDADALDVSQNVLTRIAGAIQRWEKRDEETRFRHWLRRVAKNAILDALKGQPKDAAAGGSDVQELLSERAEMTPDFDAELAKEHQREQYLRAAAVVRTDVSSETWRAFELTVIEGKSCEETATVVGKSIGTVYAARSRIYRRLRDQIQKMEGER